MAMVEFGLLLPVLAVFLFGTIEVSRYLLLNQKLDKAVNAMADFATQGLNIRTAEIDGYAAAIPQIMKPFSFNGTVIFTSAIHYNNGIPPCQDASVVCISWQVRKLGNDTSKIGAVGDGATLPDGYEVKPGQNVIAAEIYMDYQPLLSISGTLIPSLAAHKLYRVVAYKPRARNLGILGN